MSKIKCPLPPMGWNSYCTCDCEPTEDLMLSSTDLMVSLGLRDAGYQYVNLDDGWLKPERDANGRLQYRDDIFPRGMKFMTDYIHDRGMKAGIYLGAGMTTWNGDAGSLGHEFEDARSIAEWGFDYLKYDRHPSEDDICKDTVTNYVTMGLAVKNCGRDIIYNLCEHGTSEPWLWAAPVGQLWRTGKDIRDNWRYIERPDSGLGILDMMDMVVAPIARYGHKGGYNDPDMLITGMHHQNEWMGQGCTNEEYRSVFAIWCMLAAPLLIGADLRCIDPAGVEILKNPGLISINQDPLVIPAERKFHDPLSHDMWCRPLSDFKWAVCLVNRANDAKELGFTLDDLGLSKALPVKLTDAWTGEEIARVKNGEYSLTVKRHDSAVIIVEPDIAVR